MNFIDNETPLNAEVMNKGNWRDDETLSFISTVKPVSAESNITKIYTDTQGESWIVPPINSAEAYKLSSGDNAYKNLSNLRDATTGQINSLQGIINSLFNIMTQPFTAGEYDGRNISASVYDGKNITALNFDLRGSSLLI